MDGLSVREDRTASRLLDLAERGAPSIAADPHLAVAVVGQLRAARRRRTAIAAGVTGLAVVVAATAAAYSPGHSDYFTVTQPSRAMAPNVGLGDDVVFDKTLAPARGDVVYVRIHVGGGSYDVIERVGATAGQTISCPARADRTCAGIEINGRRVADPAGSGPTAPFAAAAVPAGTVFLLGDNRPAANDSRYIGPVSLRDIHGVAVTIDHDGHSGPVRWAPPHRAVDGDVDPAGTVPPAPAGSAS